MLSTDQVEAIANLLARDLLSIADAERIVKRAYRLTVDEPEPPEPEKRNSIPSYLNPSAYLNVFAEPGPKPVPEPERGVNPDAVLVANYFWKLPDNVLDALAACLGNSANPAYARTLANYINELPPDIIAALKRILQITN